MLRTTLSKALLILAILALCAIAMYPPSRKLKPGLDLAGGTTLVYQVQVPPGEDGKNTVDRVISVLRDRVDPTGVRNLIWRPQAGNRIEIQMALPDKTSVDRRAEYLRQQKKVLESNISRQTIDTLLRADATVRSQVIKDLSQGDEARTKTIVSLTQAYDAMQAAQGPYREAQAEFRAAQEALEKLPAEARAPLSGKVEALQKELIARTRAFNEARTKFAAAEKSVLTTNIDAAELDRIVNLSNITPPKTEDGTTPISPRQALLQKLINDHPGRTQDLQAFADTFAEYEKVKGPLDDPNDLIQLLRGSGVLEFRIAGGVSKVPDAESYRAQLAERGPRAGSDRPYRWFPIDKVESFAEKRADQEMLRANPEAYFAQRGLIGAEYGGNYFVLLGNSLENSLSSMHQGWKLSTAYPTRDSYGFPAVGFQLNAVGGQYMASLTGSHISEPMAILLDGKVMSAPNIQSRIADSGIITGGRGGFSEKELNYLVRTLSAGSLAASIGQEPISIQTTGPQFGQDNLAAGLRAVYISILVVSIFMAIYYFKFGLVADAAMLANLVLVLGVMAMLDATFTLPGIAGMVLTVGMAVDANVLVYERIREELQRGSPLRTAVRLGFQKAWSTIFDSHVTSLITCVVLGYTATADIKGFAVVLGVGLLANLFTGVFCTRVVMELAMDLFHVREAKMLPMVSPGLQKALHPNIDWIGKRWLFLGLSWVVAGIGLVSIATRGADFLDIEFRSGTQIGFRLAPELNAEGKPVVNAAGEAQLKTLSLQEVRQRLTTIAKQPGLESMAEATAVTVGNAVNGKYSEFTIATIMTDVDAVSTAIKNNFSDVLDTQRPIAFRGSSESTLPANRAVPLPTAQLGEHIGRPDVTKTVADYIGGVAILLDDLSPAPSIDELTDRIQRMRLQPAYEKIGLRQFTVIGLDPAPGDMPTAGLRGPFYRSAVIVSRDANADSSDNVTSVTEPGGLAHTEWALIRDALQRDTSLGSVSKFDSQFSQTMKQQAIVATIASCIAIVIYIWFRFGSLRYGLAAIAATLHDFVIAIGMIGLSAYLYEVTPLRELLKIEPFRLNLAQVAALLTIIGYSLNDTVVVFDRIRENRGRLALETPTIINDSINQTISRTILTSVTTTIAVTILYIVGGPGVRGFAYTMLIGIVIGTYSSIAIAAPLLLVGRKDHAATPAAVPATTR